MAHVNKDRVKEITTTTGTGPFTVAGTTVAGYKRFQDACNTGDTFRGVIQAVDASGAPTGEWQAGTFTYSALNQITTLTVEWSSTGSAVSFSAGTKQIWIGMTAAQAGWIREKLTADRTYYVRSDGSDSNTGLANTSGGAFLTIQKAEDVLATLDGGGFAAFIQLGDATYTAGFVGKPLVGFTSVTIQGNAATPANVLVSTTSSNCFTNAISTVPITVKDLKMTTTTSGSCLFATSGATISFINVNFGSCAGHHRYALGGTVIATGSYTISGGAASHTNANSGGVNTCTSKTVTLSGTPAFSVGYAVIAGLGTINDYSNTFSGSATGKRYDITLGGVCQTLGSGATYLPGNASGTSPTGYYV